MGRRGYLGKIQTHDGFSEMSRLQAQMRRPAVAILLQEDELLGVACPH